MIQFSEKCGRCSNLVDFMIRDIFDHTQISREEMAVFQDHARAKRLSLSPRPTPDLTPKARITGSTLSHCPRCRGPVMIVFECQRDVFSTIENSTNASASGLTGMGKYLKITEMYPKPFEPESSPTGPKKLRDCL